jgi:DtxR family Mn-dependent transcriptional regulator
MEAALRFPKFDPHGDPIPSQTGKIPKLKDSVLLSSGKLNTAYEVVRVSDSDDQFLHYLESLGLTLKSFLTIKEIRPFDKSLLIDMNGQSHSVSQFTARHIWVSTKTKVKDGVEFK